MYLTAYGDPRLGGGAAARFEDRGAACAQLLAAAARRGPAAAAAAARACFGYLSSPWWTGAAAGGAAAAEPPPGSEGPAALGQEEQGEEERGGGLALWGGPALAAAWLCAQHDRALAVGDLAAAAALAGQLAGLADPQPHRDVDIRWVGGEVVWCGLRWSGVVSGVVWVGVGCEVGNQDVGPELFVWIRVDATHAWVHECTALPGRRPRGTQWRRPTWPHVLHTHAHMNTHARAARFPITTHCPPPTHTHLHRLEAARRGCLNLLAAGNTAAAHEAAMDLFARCADAGAPAIYRH